MLVPSALIYLINLNLRKFEQFWVEIWLKNFVCKIQNSGQITHPSIDLKVVLKRKLAKDFKKVGPICGNLSYKSQLIRVWAVLGWNLPKNFVSKIQNSGQITQPSIHLKVVLQRKLDKDFKKVGPICGNLSYKSQKFEQFWVEICLKNSELLKLSLIVI